MNSLHPGKELQKLDYMLKGIPLKGSSCCSSKGNRNGNPVLSYYRRMICISVVYHKSFQKYIFL